MHIEAYIQPQGLLVEARKMVYRWIGATCASGMIFFPTLAMASQSSGGYVAQVLVTTDSRAYFEQSGARTSRPACATATRWVIDTSTLAGQAILSLVLTAQAQRMPVYVSGSGNCALWGDSETAAGVQTAN